MLAKYLPVLMTAASFFIAIALHWFYKASFLLPSFLAALGSSVLVFLCLRLLPLPFSAAQLEPDGIPWNVIGFSFVSSFVLAILIGYLMKYSPSLFK